MKEVQFADNQVSEFENDTDLYGRVFLQLVQRSLNLQWSELMEEDCKENEISEQNLISESFSAFVYKN